MSKSAGMFYPDGTRVGDYSPIGNNVLDKIADIELTRAEREVLTRVIEDTIGWEKSEGFGGSIRRLTYEIPVDRFEDKTGLSQTDITAALDNLEKRQIIKRDGDSITFNHHLDEWV